MVGEATRLTLLVQLGVSVSAGADAAAAAAPAAPVEPATPSLFITEVVLCWLLPAARTF